jgi:nitroimidazol reductase NimA-like FMN-containing flavoprotein (pyridoxamine 5'-phosphate oxidase superfamily)
VDADGRAYGTPLSIVRDGGEVGFHCAGAGRKTDNLRRDPRVVLVCVGAVREPPDGFTVEYESAVVSGEAREVTGREEKRRWLRLLCERHSPGNMAAFEGAAERGLDAVSVWKVRIGEVTGKRNPGVKAGGGGENGK